MTQTAEQIIVFLVDDQVLTSRLLHEMLKDHKEFTLISCQTPHKAEEMAIKNEPDVILLDLFMPGTDGLTLLKALRQQPQLQHTPMIILSVEEKAEIKRQAYALGANDYMVKLPDRLEVLARLRYHARVHQNHARLQQSFQTQKQILAKLQEKEDLLQGLVQSLPDPIFLVDETGDVWNIDHTNLNNFPSSSIPMDQFFCQKAVEQLQHQIKKSLTQQASCCFEFPQADLMTTWYEAQINPLSHKRKGKRFAVIVLRDITDRKQAEQAQKKAHRALTALNLTSEAVSRATTEKALLQEICRLIVEVAGYHFSWVGYTNPENESQIRPVAWNENHPNHFNTEPHTLEDKPGYQSPIRTAIRTKKFMISRSSQQDPCLLSSDKKNTNFYASIALPLIQEEEIFGTLNIYAKEQDVFRKDEVKLLVRISNNLAFGIHTLRQRRARRTAQHALKAYQAQMQAVFDHMEMIVFLKGIDGHYLMSNRYHDTLLGLHPKQVIGRNAFDIFPRETAQIMVNNDRHVHTTKKSFFGEEAFVIEGEKRTFLMHKFPLWDSEENLFAIGAVATEITERKKAEQKLRESEARYRALVDLSPDGILVHRHGEIVFINPAMIQLLGGEYEETFLHRNIFSFVHPDSLASVKRRIHHAIHEDQPQPYQEQKLIRLDKTAIDVEAAGTPVWFKGARAVQVVVRDFTERKQHEKALKQAKELAESASRAKSDFLAVMSHEIRTPINSILGAAELLQETTLNKKQHNLLDISQKAGNALLALVDNILDISRIESGELVLENLTFNLHALAKETLHIHSLKANKKGLKLKQMIASDIPKYVEGDPTRLRQILVNLVNNAIKFTRQGQITLHLSKNEEQIILFAVEDQGIGISKEKQSTIFDSFTQADTSNTREFGGSGLGLSICKQLVEHMGGEIHVESVLGKGSIFRFSLPLKSRPKPEILDQPPHKTAHKKSKHNPQKKKNIPTYKILLAEDSQDNRFLIKAFLKHLPYHIVMAENGQEAVQCVKQESFDLILMDLQMPIMDGFTATQTIRQLEQKRGDQPIPIIALTAHAFKEASDKALAAGCDFYLTKPVNKKRLQEEVGRFLKAHAKSALSPSARAERDRDF
ncbi:response regulator [Magnetococcales bacterium HHB-1]